MSFSNDIAKFNLKVQNNFLFVKKRAAFGLFSAIVMETPVDKGVLRNNWQMNLNYPADSTLADGDVTGSAVLSRIKSQIEGVDPVSYIYFTNNLSYAKRIEYDGWSGKAPEGMLRVNIARWPAIVKAAARGVK
jgi:hypothetical protein